MPTYVYRCRSCGFEFERLQRITDEPIRECPRCERDVMRVVFPVGIVFKGSGFHVNDYPTSKSKSAPESKPEEKKETAAAKKD